MDCTCLRVHASIIYTNKRHTCINILEYTSITVWAYAQTWITKHIHIYVGKEGLTKRHNLFLRLKAVSAEFTDLRRRWPKRRIKRALGYFWHCPSEDACFLQGPYVYPTVCHIRGTEWVDNYPYIYIYQYVCSWQMKKSVYFTKYFFTVSFFVNALNSLVNVGHI